MNKKFVLLLFPLVSSGVFGGGALTSTAKITGGYIPIKSVSNGAWQVKNQQFELVSSQRVSGGLGVIKGHLIVRSIFDIRNRKGSFEVLQCKSSGLVNICKKIVLDTITEYDSFIMRNRKDGGYEIETVYDNEKQVTNDFIILKKETNDEK